MDFFLFQEFRDFYLFTIKIYTHTQFNVFIDNSSKKIKINNKLSRHVLKVTKRGGTPPLKTN